MSLQEVAEEYGITEEDVRAALGYAASVLAAEAVGGVALPNQLRRVATLIEGALRKVAA